MATMHQVWSSHHETRPNVQLGVEPNENHLYKFPSPALLQAMETKGKEVSYGYQGK